MTSLSAPEIDHILQNKKCEFLGALTDVLDSEQYNIVVEVLEEIALPKMFDRLFDLDDKRAVIPDKILCLSCKHMVEPMVYKFREGKKYGIKIHGVYCDRYAENEDDKFSVSCRVDCYQYEPKP